MMNGVKKPGMLFGNLNLFRLVMHYKCCYTYFMHKWTKEAEGKPLVGRPMYPTYDVSTNLFHVFILLVDIVI